ncbi:hypothetical protein FKW77_008357 [Venturia effusa]|uniref:Zona occludens toxin N-terminal domain-containing protein n=1 Tax=Venturia effusa TaxID=50376 RepID=A0A517L9R8_9PEZI|nr:hypothetical protein FKW77_008357 [Venturia effusa]
MMSRSKAKTLATEREAFTSFLQATHLTGVGNSKRTRMEEEMQMTPLFSCSAQEAASANNLGTFPQYGLLGHAIPMPFERPTDVIDPILLNTDTPCSHCEAAHLCSQGIPVTILVSPSNFAVMSSKYASIPGAQNNITVEKLYLHESYLSTERLMRLMAFGDDASTAPLYLQTILKILRSMATESQGASAFDYSNFKKRLELENLTGQQNQPLQLRLDILESFMGISGQNEDPNRIKGGRGGRGGFRGRGSRGFRAPMLQALASPIMPKPNVQKLLAGKSGTLTIVDLTDPTIDTNTACVLFDIALTIFMEKTPCGRIVGLDEAHNYLHNGPASENFTNNLLKAVREQRHRAARVVVATQEPTVSPKFLELCSMIFVHGFNSPDWFKMLRNHVGGAEGVCLDFEKKGRRFMDEIIELDTGESFLFARSALLDAVDGSPVKLGAQVRKFRTRQRLTDDGGRSQNVTKQTVVESKSNIW